MAGENKFTNWFNNGGSNIITTGVTALGNVLTTIFSSIGTKKAIENGYIVPEGYKTDAETKSNNNMFIWVAVAGVGAVVIILLIKKK